MVGLYPSIPHYGGLEVLPKQYDKFKDKIVPTEDIIKSRIVCLKIIFLKDLNEFHSNLKFTYEKSKEKTNFLYLVIKLTDDKIFGDLYCKPTL